MHERWADDDGDVVERAGEEQREQREPEPVGKAEDDNGGNELGERRRARPRWSKAGRWATHMAMVNAPMDGAARSQPNPIGPTWRI